MKKSFIALCAALTLGTAQADTLSKIKDSGAIRAQILDQLKTMMLASSDIQDVDADSLLVELAGDEPHPDPTPAAPEWDSAAHVHSNDHEQSQEISDPPEFSDPVDPTVSPSEPPPCLPKRATPGGDIFGGNDDVAKL